MTVIKKGKLYEISSEKVQVGDILHLKEDQEVPCDVIVLSTSHSQVSHTEFGQRIQFELDC